MSKATRAEYSDWYNAVKARDDETCQYPGCHVEGEDMEAHHVYGKTGALRLNVDNGIYLCHDHHSGAHAKLKAFRTWFENEYPERAKRIKGLKSCGTRT